MKIIQLSGSCETYECPTEGEYPGMNTHEEMFFLENRGYIENQCEDFEIKKGRFWYVL